MCASVRENRCIFFNIYFVITQIKVLNLHRQILIFNIIYLAIMINSIFTFNFDGAIRSFETLSQARKFFSKYDNSKMRKLHVCDLFAGQTLLMTNQSI